MLSVNAAGKQWRQQIVLFDPVVEGVDHAVERLSATCPLEEGRIIHRQRT
jgi:hypothetical protein